jgi:3-oxoacyl-[acyl-carrier-protein] synthase III
MDCILDIVAQGAWNGGALVDNSIYENKGMQFKGGIPVNHNTIEARIGVRTRMAAPADERIGVIAFKDLLSTNNIDPSRIKVIISATNIGEDKFDPGPFVRFPYAEIKESAPHAFAFDLYAGCPGFNVAVESVFMLSLTGQLSPGDLSVIVGAENIHRAEAFRPHDTANIIFGDDALATALETRGNSDRSLAVDAGEEIPFVVGSGFIDDIADLLMAQELKKPLDGIIMDNQLGKLEYRVPASAVRVQHALVERMNPRATERGDFQHFREALDFYDHQAKGFAFDIMTLDNDPRYVQQLAAAYAASGRYPRVAAIYLAPDGTGLLSIKKAARQPLTPPRRGIIDTLTRTHGCFAGYIEAIRDGEDLYGLIDGKGVFLHATRSARKHIETLLSRNHLEFQDIELMIEHQANFAMIPLTLEQVIGKDRSDAKQLAANFLANRMVTNVHLRGNCSVVCMQRLPYDLERDALEPDTIQDLAVNRNLERLRKSRLVLYDSVGAGMTRSTFLRRR